jgi:hypothetical protein
MDINFHKAPGLGLEIHECNPSYLAGRNGGSWLEANQAKSETPSQSTCWLL